MSGGEARTTGKRLRLELPVAGAPTAQCRRQLAMIKELVARYPDRVRLDVYEAGASPYVTPTAGYPAAGKRKKVPSAFVNGVLVASKEGPGDNDRLVTAVGAVLARSEAERRS